MRRLHSDRANNGGLSLEAFDAAAASPSLSAMMLSKITSGTALATVNAAGHDTSAATVLDRGLKKGAINAAGVGVPPSDFVDALVTSFAAKSAAASQWSVERTKRGASDADVVTVSIVRELPSAPGSGRPADIEAAMYRLVLTCDATSREGTMQLAGPRRSCSLDSVALVSASSCRSARSRPPASSPARR